MGVAAARVAPALAFALLLVLAGVGTGAAVGADVEPTASSVIGPPQGPSQTTSGDSPPETTTVIRISLRTNGNAHWNVTTAVPINSTVDRQAFDRLAEEHESDGLDALSADPFENAADRSARATGRPMAIEAVEYGAMRGEETGHLSLRFTWTNFTRSDGNEIRLGDVFQTPSGTWLPALEPNQILVIEFPEGYTVRDSSRRLTNGTIRVEGPAAFEPGQPSAVLRETEVELPNDGLTTEEIIGLVLGVAVFVGGVVYVMTRRRRRTGDEVTGAASAAEGADDDRPEPSLVEASDHGTVGTDDETVTDAAGGPLAEGPESTDDQQADEPLLSDEERVEQLLAANGGRMKQVDIVAETGWSNAKVSQLLSAMDEDGRVEKLRIGRENLISLPDHEESTN